MKNRIFIDRANLVHSDKYDYSKVDYKKAKTKVIITCKIHGDFEQIPDSHLRGRGCPNCGDERIRIYKKSNRETFINKANKKHSFKYSYNNLVYTESRGKGVITCPIHGDFTQELNSHIRGAGCKECQKETLSTIKSKEVYSWKHSDWEKCSKKSKFFKGFTVYIIKCYNEDETFYKIGKTFRKLNKRFDSKKAMPYFWEVVKEFSFNNSKEASNFEVVLHNKNKDYKHFPKKSFCGSKECYSNIKKEGE